MCGLFGKVTFEPRVFDRPLIYTLGVANDTRGGDSCGIFIDGEVDYGFGKDSELFGDYFISSDFLEKRDKGLVTVTLGHCRKASVGGVRLDAAQPVVIKNDKDEVEFVMIHNGTIHNYDDLAKKYIPDESIAGLTDSQVMAKIFYRKGYACLSEYYGGAAFVIVDYRGGSPDTLIFKGASKKSEYSKEAEVERPLFYVKSNGEFIFSSIYQYLYALRPDEEAYIVPENRLLRATPTGNNDDTLRTIRKVDRSKVTQTKKTIISTSTYSGGYWNGGGYGRCTYGGWDHVSGGATTKLTTTSPTTVPSPIGYGARYLVTDDSDNTYSYDGNKLHGIYRITKHGRIMQEGAAPWDGIEPVEVGFFGGILIPDTRVFEVLERTRVKMNSDALDFASAFNNLVRYFSFDKIFFDKDGKARIATGMSDKDNELFTGTYHQFSNIWAYNYENGVTNPTKERVYSTYDNPAIVLDGLKKNNNRNSVDFKRLVKLCKLSTKSRGRK